MPPVEIAAACCVDHSDAFLANLFWFSDGLKIILFLFLSRDSPHVLITLGTTAIVKEKKPSELSKKPCLGFWFVAEQN